MESCDRERWVYRRRMFRTDVAQISGLYEIVSSDKRSFEKADDWRFQTNLDWVQKVYNH